MINIDFMVFCVTAVVIFLGYMHQLLNIVVNKSSAGVSYKAYIVSLIATLILIIATDSTLLKIIGILEALLCLITLPFIKCFRGLNSSNTSAVAFFTALSLSVFMIHGVLQAIKSYRREGPSSVSIPSYVLYTLLSLFMLVMTEGGFVTTTLLINIALYIYIIMTTYFNNRQYIPFRQQKLINSKAVPAYIKIDDGLYGVTNKFQNSQID